MEKAEIQLMIMELISQIEELIKSKDFYENLIKKTVKETLIKQLEEKNISSEDYEKALDILNDYNFKLNLK